MHATAAHRVTTVCAPAGYGKSVLLAEWAATASATGRFVWLRLDATDDRPDRFGAALAAAMAVAGAVTTDAPPPAPAAGGAHDLVALVDVLLAPLAGATSPVTLVLDDAHLLTHPAVLHAVDYLAEFSPRQLRLVLAHRAEPRLRLARLGLAGQLATLGPDDLACTRRETARLLELNRVDLDADQVDDLHALTGGWIAGVVLAARWWQRPDRTPAGLLSALRRGEVTTDYLRSEVLAALPQAGLAALARLAAVERFTADLAATLAGDLAPALTGDQAQAFPTGLYRRLPFLTAEAAPTRDLADAGGPWYRWHPLLRAALRDELASSGPGQVRAVHRRAARWFGANGDVLAALRHAGQSGDQRLVTEIVAANWLELTMSAHRDEVGRALGRLPPEAVAEHPELSVARAAVYLADGMRSAALPLAEHALARLDLAPPERRQLVAATAAGIRLYSSQLAPVPEDIRNAVLAAIHDPSLDTATPATAAAARRFLSLALAVSDRSAGAVGGSPGLCHHIGDPRASGSFPSGRDARARLSIMACYIGALDSAETQALEVIEEDPPGGSGAGLAAMTLAWVAFLRGDTDTARVRVVQSIEALAGSDVLDRCLALRLASVLHISRHELGPARAALHEAYALCSGTPAAAHVADRLASTEADLLLAEGDYPRVLRLAADHGPAGAATGYRPLLVIAADAHLYMDRPGAALHALAPWRNRRDIGLAAQISIGALRAAAEAALGRSPAARAALHGAVALAAPARLVRPLLDQRHRLVEQLTALAGADLPEAPFLRRLLDDIRADLRLRPPPARLPQPLTPRELEILRYLRSRLPLGEIAEVLRLSPNTVKTHVRHIYEKLQVTGRQEAVARASELNLL